MKFSRKSVFAIILVLSVFSFAAFADDPRPNVVQFLSTVGSSGGSSTGYDSGQPQATFDDGYIRTLNAPEGESFPVSGVVPGDSSATARNFIFEQGSVFGVISASVDFTVKKSKSQNGRNFERFQQTYAGIPVFGGEVIIQLNQDDGVEFALSDIMRDTQALDGGSVSTVPTVSGVDAGSLATNLMAAEHAGVQLTNTVPQLMIYEPAVIGNFGASQLVWHTVVTNVSGDVVNEVILVNAHSGEIALRYSQIIFAKNRVIYDVDGDDAAAGTLERDEGDPPSGIEDVDFAYDYLGDTYDFYSNEHGRDGIDDAGMLMKATVRFTFLNAYWAGSEMLFGAGLVTDDITAHELTHGVTQYESSLIYQNDSGAINESFSDMWGEWVDLSNTGGNDDPSVRWLMGEDATIMGGAIRDMKNPPSFGDPDSKCSPYWYDGTGDYGGVHTNCGVGNKLCYLLTDGDTFKGVEIRPLGISAVADLMYAVQTTLLTSGADYADFHAALTQAAVNLGWDTLDKITVERACLVTELTDCFDPDTTIVPSYLDVISPAPDPMGWETEPVAVGLTTIYMKAAVAIDSSGVEYFFDCVTDDTYDSDWQDSRIYYRGDYAEGTTYEFRVKARDKSESLNETGYSETAEATTASGTDTLKPSPNPTQWKGVPARVPNMIRIVMQAEAYDELGGAIEYYFECVNTNDPVFPDPSALDSGWTTNSFYQRSDITGADNNSYVFRTRARDAAGNTTDWSTEGAVVFAPPPTVRVVSPIGGYPTIQAAIDACNQGDTVFVPEGTYTGTGNVNLNFTIPAGKVGGGNLLQITVRGNVDNPGSTIIDGGNSARAFEFQNGEGSNVVIEGFTIQNAVAPVDTATTIHALGGAIYASVASSPVIRHCIFSNCNAYGLQGVDGVDGVDPAAQAAPNGDNGTSGGDGFGGVMYFVAGSQPAITNCQITNCSAVGGDGGDGGDGDIGVPGDAAAVPPVPDTPGGTGGNGGNAGIAAGGAMYFEPGCQPQLVDVEISSCQISVGQIGSGGNGGDGEDANPPTGSGGNGGNTGDLNGSFVHAGALFFDAGSTVVMRNCSITDCTISALQTSAFEPGTGGAGTTLGIDGTDNAAAGNLSNLVSYGGANFYGANSMAILDNVTIQGNTSTLNQGGGEFYDTQCITDHHDCSITGNASPGTLPGIGAGGVGGGGIYLTDSANSIFTDCVISENTAYMGAGIYIDGQTIGTFSFTNCTFSGNDSNVDDWGSFGGAIYAGNITTANNLINTPATPPFTMTVTNCTFDTNISPFGGGLCVDAVALTVTDSTFTANSAEYGGGIFAYGSQIDVNDCSFDGNQAAVTLPVNVAASGGGAYLQQSDVTILDTVFMSNDSEDSAGALAIIGLPLQNTFQTVTNCLFIDNSAGLDGGAFSAEYSAMVQVENCTFADNVVTDESGFGGGLYCFENTFVDIWDSIFWNNSAVFGPQILLGAPFETDYSFIQPSMVFVDYSDVQGGQDGIDTSADASEWAWFSDDSIQDDPLFVTVDTTISTDNYRLSHIATGQLDDSPCIDTGSTTAIAVGLDTYTTRTDQVVDSNEVDMGYHYDAQEPNKSYTLTLKVDRGDETTQLIASFLGDPTPDITITANTPLEEREILVPAGVVVALQAEFTGSVYRVARWIGTSDDSSFAQTNTVSMSFDRTVMVEFELDVTKNLYVPDSYDTIEDAMLAAHSGDKIILRPRPNSPYLIENPDGINFGGKELLFTSIDPNDSLIVAQTIIDCQGSRYLSKRAFHFESGEGMNSKIEGITIRNAFTAVIGDSGAIYTGMWPWADGMLSEDDWNESPPDPLPPTRGLSGEDATGDSYGGAILIENGSSPLIRNCIFEDCTVAGGVGGDGEDGNYGCGYTNVTEDWDSQSGGHSGKGIGDGYGGAIAILDGSNPRIENCKFLNNRATGGWGGIPGNAGCSYNGGRYGWGGNDWAGLYYAYMNYPGLNDWFDAGNGEGDGRGGAVFIAAGCNPQIQQCTFEGNYARPGYVSAGGSEAGGAAYAEPFDDAAPPVAWGDEGMRDGGDGSLTNNGTIAGGAIFIEEEANVTLEGCEFIENEAYVRESYEDDPYDSPITTRGGAVYVDPNAILNIRPIWNEANPNEISVKSVFEDNIAGALYCATGIDLTVEQTEFVNNSSYYPVEEQDTLADEFLLDFYDKGTSEPTGTYDIAGAITVEIDTERKYTSQIIGCQFFNNTSHVGGGAIRTDSDMTLTDCVLNGNSAPTNGGAVYSYVQVDSPETYTTELTFNNCELSGNESEGLGGAGFMRNCNLTVNDCFLNQNTAFSGGALRLSYGDLVMKDSLLYGNEATGAIAGGHRTVTEEGFGGGLHVTDSPFLIEHTRFENNTAGGLLAAGGGLCITGSQTYYQQNLLNCLFVNNHSDNVGSGVAALLYVDADFKNCTFADNTNSCEAEDWSSDTRYLVNDCVIGSDGHKYKSIVGTADSPNVGHDPVEDTDGNYWKGADGSAVYVDDLSILTINNSIISGNAGFGIYEKSGGNSEVSNSLFSSNQDGDMRNGFDGMAYAGDALALVPDYTGNHIGDPQFARDSLAGPLGNYYLVQTNSLTVDAGSGLASDIGLSSYTTDPDGMLDQGNVDRGFHYPDPLDIPEFNLSVSIVDEDGVTLYNAGTVTVTPSSVSGKHSKGAVLELSADIDDAYFLTGWSGGTIDDDSQENTNWVVMASDKTLQVQVRFRQTLMVGASSKYDNLGDAIDDAQDGDFILVAPGEYTSGSGHPSPLNEISLSGKVLTITGSNPDDESVVRSTVFRDFSFDLNNLNDETVIEGITLEQSGMDLHNADPIIRNCVFSECQFYRISGVHLDPPAGTDGHHQRPIFGGAIEMYFSSPKIVNCIFEDNSVTGANGEDGYAGDETYPNGGDGGWPSQTYGGAVYCGFSSNPEFISCTFTGNEVFGGTGGTGADFFTDADGILWLGGRGGGWEYDDITEQWFAEFTWDGGWDGWCYNSRGDKYEPYWYYGGYYLSELWGMYDLDVWGKWFNWDESLTSWDEVIASPPDALHDQKMEAWRYSGYGGAVYCEFDSDATFTDCDFVNNQSHGGLTGIGGAQHIDTLANGVPWPDRQLNLPTAGGAVYAAYDSDVKFTGCSFSGNVADKSTVELPHTFQISFGGAVAYEFDCEVTFTDCDFEENDATVGGALYGFDTYAEVADCNFVANEAYLGAGFYSEDYELDVTNSIFRSNVARSPDVVVETPDDDDQQQGDDDPVVPVATIDATGYGAGLMAVAVDMNVKDTIFVDNDSEISGGGLLITGAVERPTEIFNCLFAENIAARDGGGASVNWSSDAMFTNCTFADNSALGSFTEVETGNMVEVVIDEETGETALVPEVILVPEYVGSGGGLYCATDSVVNVNDSIFWGNGAAQGAQVTVGTGFEFDPRPSELTIGYSDVAGYPSANAIYVGPGCTLNVGDGVINNDPLFEASSEIASDGISSNYYLDQLEDPDASPCKDAGSRGVFDAELSDYTTSIFSGLDKGVVDLGYHYRVSYRTACSLVDFALSGHIDIEDWAQFAANWLFDSCGEGNNWCNGTDVNYDMFVDVDDMLQFTSCWLESDTEKPFPNPVTWDTEPAAVPDTFDTIEMQADAVHDQWWPDDAIEYYFDCVAPDTTEFDSGWQTDPYWTRSGLEAGTYTYVVYARDGSDNMTGYEAQLERSVTPGSAVVMPDAEWAVDGEPDNAIVYPGPVIAVVMEAEDYESLPDAPSLPANYVAKYQFEKDGFLQPYQESAIWEDTDVIDGQTYSYRVRVGIFSDAASTEVVAVGGFSPAIEVLVVPADLLPPYPTGGAQGDPAEHASVPGTIKIGSLWYQVVFATEAVDDSGVEYKFVCSDSDLSSGNVGPEWRNASNVGAGVSPTHPDYAYPDGSLQIPTLHVATTGIANNTGLLWWIYYRDQSPLQNIGRPSSKQAADGTVIEDWDL